MNRALVKKIQGDLPLQDQLFSARECAELKKMLKTGQLRRFAAVLDPVKLGYTASCMVAWRVGPKKIDQLGREFARLGPVSHCYERPTFKDFPYNLYTMVHGRSKNSIIRLVKRAGKKLGLPDYQMLWSLKEYKKSSPIYVV